jgi:hypothetical protein
MIKFLNTICALTQVRDKNYPDAFDTYSKPVSIVSAINGTARSLDME